MALAGKPITFNQDQMKDLANQAQSQSVGQKYNPSKDPENFPVFESPTGGKYVAYLANMTHEDGSEMFDSPILYSVNTGGKYPVNLRSPEGLVLEGVFDGTNPFREAIEAQWEWYNAEKEMYQAKTGQTMDGENHKETRKRLLNQFKIDSKPMVRHIIPAYIARLGKDPEGHLKLEGAQLCWLNLTQITYAKFTQAIENDFSDYAKGTPAGKMFLLDYDYPLEGKKTPSARDAVRYLTVSLMEPSKMGFDQNFLDDIDEKLKEWTPTVAINTVKICEFYATDDLRKTVDPITDHFAKRAVQVREEVMKLTGPVVSSGPTPRSNPVPAESLANAAEPTPDTPPAPTPAGGQDLPTLEEKMGNSSSPAPNINFGGSAPTPPQPGVSESPASQPSGQIPAPSGNVNTNPLGNFNL